MYCRLHDLNRCIIPDVRCRYAAWQRDLREADRAWVRVLGWTDDLEDGYHGEGHVGWSVIGTVRAKAHVHVEEGGSVTLEPSGLEGDGAAVYGPVGTICCGAHAAAWKMSVSGGLERWFDGDLSRKVRGGEEE